MAVVVFLQVFVDGVATGDMVGDIIVDDITGQVPAVMLPCDELGPTKSPSRVPPTMIVYVTPQCSPLTVTVADWLVIGAIPVIRHNTAIMLRNYKKVHVFKLGTYVRTYITCVLFGLLKQWIKQLLLLLLHAYTRILTKSITSFSSSSIDVKSVCY